MVYFCSPEHATADPPPEPTLLEDSLDRRHEQISLAPQPGRLPRSERRSRSLDVGEGALLTTKS